MHLICLTGFILVYIFKLYFVNSKKIIALNNHVKLIPIKNELYAKKYKVLKKLNFIFKKKNKNKYELKNLENIPLFVITNEFDEIILSFNLDDENEKKEKKRKIDFNENSDYLYDIVWERDTFLFPLIKNKEKRRKEINLDNIHNNNCISIFFFDMKTAEAYKDDILYLFSKNLMEKKKNKLFFGSKIKLTNLEYFFKIKNSYKSKIDFVLIPNYKELQNVLKNKNIFYGTPIYYINRIKLHKSFIKKNFYELFYKNLKKETKIELSPNIFITYTIEQEEKSNSLIIQLETENKKYIPIFFSYKQAIHFYNIFLKYFKNNFTDYCLPKPHIVLNSFENILILSKFANDKKIDKFYNLFFIPNDFSFYENLCSNNYNAFTFYIKKFFQKINYDLFRSFRKNLNYLISDYIYE
ncbi:conserved Plasmodium protein, unknown function [Plasmodium gallinaceum]|uniref:Uncharacterized protein n=1 Tax=Plasmodium gallinaceum TaxID=5849 RepID=A0A1J1GLI4_PLAGA|nr:conserved Plasmodium protein, unknown function [Plasmodium gallinaceum]CRG93187.1 conserved Plasmodium protein, unknown function [Plasmodium gallinaceum]